MTGHGQLIKQYREGTHRLVAPCETLARVRPLLPTLGITRLANVTGLDRIGIPVVMACRPASRSLSVSQGKGLDLEAAKASAVMESIEGYHAERILLPLKLASYEEMCATHRVVDVSRLSRCVNSRFHPHLPLLWIEGQDWISHAETWVPFQMVHTAYTADLEFDLGSFLAVSSGLASGNHIIEAASHAICEVAERDSLWRFTHLCREEKETLRLDLDSVDDPHCQSLLERFRHAGVSVAVWDVTSAVGIPAFFALISEGEDNPHRRLYGAEGSGCHPDRNIALSRALTEAAQSRLTAISGARDDILRHDYVRWREPETLAENRRAASVRGARPFTAVPSFVADSLEADLEWELTRLRRAGFDEVIVCDLRRPEFGIPVVRVIIPGMRHIHGQEAAS